MKKDFSSRMKFKNVSIKRRILLSNISMILVPILIICIAAPVVVSFLGNLMNMDTVTSSKHDLVGQVQWNVAIDSINAAILKSGTTDNTVLLDAVHTLEESGSQILIEKDGTTAYSTNDANALNLLSDAQQILGKPIEGHNLFSVSNEGLVSVSYIQSEQQVYRIVIQNKTYVTTPIGTDLTTPVEDTLHFFAGRLGILVLSVVGVFALTIVCVTFLTATGINRPITQLRICTNEITNGNLDYEMEYDSTNEFGMLIKDYDQMRLKLKDSLHNQKLLEQQRKEMIAGISHDLRTPLTSIKGYVEGLIDGIASTPTKQKEYLKTIYTTANEMDNIVSELFLFSKLDVDKVTLEKENIAIVNYMADFCEEEKFELEKSDIEIDFSFSCDRMTTVAIDRPKFDRVILNIISNSVKYRKPAQQGHIDVHISKNEKFVCIKFADNGIGIDEESVDHVFETFYRADPARANVREGSGIGLSICKKIVELHDGTVWATGKLGEGMAVTIALPLLEIKEKK